MQFYWQSYVIFIISNNIESKYALDGESNVIYDGERTLIDCDFTKKYLYNKWKFYCYIRVKTISSEKRVFCPRVVSIDRNAQSKGIGGGVTSCTIYIYIYVAWTFIFFIKNSNTKSLLYLFQYIFPTSGSRHSSVFFLATNNNNNDNNRSIRYTSWFIKKLFRLYHIKILCCAIYYKTLTCRRNVDGSYLRE